MSNTNNNNDLFILAATNKFRFVSTKGHLTVEDLFDLSLSALDTIAVSLDEKIQQAGRKSFIGKRSSSAKGLEDQLEIVKFVIAYKQDEAEKKKTRAEKAARRQFLENLKEKKVMESMESMSVEDIEKELAEV